MQILKNRAIARFLGKRADTRGGLSKGLGAFRIGRPLVKDNRRAQKAFRRGFKFIYNRFAGTWAWPCDGAATSAAWRSDEPNRSAKSKIPAIRPSRGCSTMKAGIRMARSPFDARTIQPEQLRQNNSGWRPSPACARNGAYNQENQEHHKKQLGNGCRHAGQSKKAHIAGYQGEDQKSNSPSKHDIRSCEL
jgi:hypothetical protein